MVIIRKALETNLRTWGYWNPRFLRRDTVELGLRALRRKHSQLVWVERMWGVCIWEAERSWEMQP